MVSDKQISEQLGNRLSGRRYRIPMRTKKVNRSIGGNILVFLLLLICGAFMVLPLYLTVVNAFKPLSELFIFPPRFMW